MGAESVTETRALRCLAYDDVARQTDPAHTNTLTYTECLISLSSLLYLPQATQLVLFGPHAKLFEACGSLIRRQHRRAASGNGRGGSGSGGLGALYTRRCVCVCVCVFVHMLTFDVFHFFFRFHSLCDSKTFK